MSGRYAQGGPRSSNEIQYPLLHVYRECAVRSRDRDDVSIDPIGAKIQMADCVG